MTPADQLRHFDRLEPGAVRYAQRIAAKRRADPGDLAQEARVGLWLAIGKWQPGCGGSVVTFAYRGVVMAVSRGLRAENAFCPALHEATARRIRRGEEIPVWWERPSSLDFPVWESAEDGDLLRLGDVIEAPQDEAASVIERLDAERLLARLTEKERKAVRLRYGEGWTDREIAARLGVARNTVSERIRRGLGEAAGGRGGAMSEPQSPKRRRTGPLFARACDICGLPVKKEDGVLYIGPGAPAWAVHRGACNERLERVVREAVEGARRLQNEESGSGQQRVPWLAQGVLQI